MEYCINVMLKFNRKTFTCYGYQKFYASTGLWVNILWTQVVKESLEFNFEIYSMMWMIGKFKYILRLNFGLFLKIFKL